MGRLILWDVDGTLLSAGAVGREVFGAAVANVLGRDEIEHGVAMSGKTDPQIALEILAELAVGDDEARHHLPGVLQVLERELEESVEVIRRQGFVHPGVREVLSRLHRTDGVVMSLLTGNLRANALVKVGAFGLDRYLDLDVGAYGSDSHDRTELVPIALERVTSRYRAEVNPQDVWVVGDTERDLECARAGRTRCLLVGTGRIPLEELAALGADEVLPDLSEVDGVVQVLTR